MAISGDYPTPVTVNGFSCRNCTDVANAKKHIDPAHPRSGPYGINAQDDPSVRKTAPADSVTINGKTVATTAVPWDYKTAGTKLDLSA